MDVIELRRARTADAESISSILLTAFTEFEPQYTEQGFVATTPNSAELVQRMEEGPIWLALKNDQAVGTVSAVLKPSGLYIRGMAVLPTARGLGIATLLLGQIDWFASEHNCKRQFLSTTPFLRSAILFYERSGFVRIADGPHDLFGTPLFTMEKISNFRSQISDSQSRSKL